MNGRSALYLLAVASLLLALELGAPVAPSAADGFAAVIAVFIGHNSVAGFHWPVGTELTLTVDDPATPASVDYQDTQIVQAGPDPYVSGSTMASFSPGEAFTIQPGHIVTLSGAGQTLTHTVTNLTLDGADMPGDRLWGTADPGSVVELRHHSQRDIVRYETVDAVGHWLADFSVAGDGPEEQLTHDFNEDTRFMVMQSNGGGHTQIDWKMLLSSFTVQLTQNSVVAWNWPLGYPVTIAIDDPSNGPGTDYSTTLDPAPSGEWAGETCGGRELGDEFRVRAGHLVTLSNGFLTQTQTVSAVQVTGMDSDADTVSGTAEPGAHLHIETKTNIPRHVTADETGNWTADFSVPGAGDDEQLTLDLIPWHEGTAAVSGGYGRTNVTWPVNLGINVGDEIKARNWYYGDEVTLTIDDPTTPVAPDYTDSGFPGVGPWAYTGIEFDVGPAFRTKPGHIVELAQTGRSKTCVVSPIAITGVDPIGDRVTGVSDPNANVLVSIPLGSGNEWVRVRFTRADANGAWQVDFSQPGTHIIHHPNEIEPVDIDSATWGSASVGDDNACFTSIEWRQPIHCAPGDTVQGAVYGGVDMTPLARATIYFDEFDTGVRRFIAETDENGAYGCWLPEGEYRIWASGRGYSREYYQEAIFEIASRMSVVDGIHWVNVDFTLDLLLAIYEHFTCNMTDPVAGDLAVRQAIAYGTDRARIISLTNPDSPIWDTYLPPDHWAHATSGVPQYNYEPQLARDILEAGGWVDGDGDGVRERDEIRLHVDYYTTANNALRQRIYEMFAANMAVIGVETHLHAIPSQELFAGDGPLYGTHEFGVAQFAWGLDLNDDQDPGAVFDSQSSQNAGLYNNAAADQARADARAVGTRAEKYPYLAQHQVLVMTDLATFPLLQRIGEAITAPVAMDDGYHTDMDMELTVAVPGVLANDLDEDSDPLAVSLVATVSYGTLTLSENGAFTYLPGAGWGGFDSFVYRVCDPHGLCDEATVTIVDNCPTIYNPDQLDSDGDGVGNACDNCPAVPNPGQADADGDGVGNACDNCPTVPNPNQTNFDGDGVGAACDCDDTNPTVYPGAPETCSDGIDQDCSGADVTCLEVYSPILFLDDDEKYEPKSIQSMLQESDLKKRTCLWLFCDYRVVDRIPVNIESLRNKNHDYFLDMKGADPGVLSYEIPHPSKFYRYRTEVYGREARFGGWIVLQYWFFYPYNIAEGSFLGIHTLSTHEGDWEMIQILVDGGTRQPLAATYSFHWGGQTYGWGGIRTTGTHPHVYVAKGGHGSWRTTGTHLWLTLVSTTIDETSYRGRVICPLPLVGNAPTCSAGYTLTSISEATHWAHFHGRWGARYAYLQEFNVGPRSPANTQYGDAANRWDDPIAWAIRPMPSGYVAIGLSPVNLHVYDAEGNHVGLNAAGEIEAEIPGSYLYMPSDGGPEVLVILTEKDLSFEIHSTGQGQFDFLLSRYNSDTSTETYVEYREVAIEEETVATLEANPQNPDYVMEIDFDGDGVVDSTKLPDSVNSEVTPPPNISGEGLSEDPPPAGLDQDGDWIYDAVDNCPSDENPDQTDTDEDGIGDVCDEDDDGDGVNDSVDNCPSKANPDQADADGDGVGDVCDNCPGAINPGQEDSDGDGIGDVCTVDSDGDGVSDAIEDGAPSDGDGNNDGSPDRVQDNVASLWNAYGNRYLTVESLQGTQLHNVQVLGEPSPELAPAGVSFRVGIVAYEVAGIDPGSPVLVTLYLPPEPDLNSYWRYGPTPDDPSDHWSSFGRDGTTGAEIVQEAERTLVHLYYVDGQRGDADLTANGQILDVGMPAVSLNQTPVAAGDVYATDEDVSLAVAAPGVLANDQDPDGDPLTVALVSDVSHGALNLNQDGSFNYDPGANWNGTDVFVYKVCDPVGLCDEATVEILVGPVNDPPTATATPQLQDVQYSDGIEQVTILATDSDSVSLTCSAQGLPNGLVLSDGDCTSNGSSVDCTWTLDGYALSGAGTYPIAFIVSDGEFSTQVGVTIVIQPEDAEVSLAESNSVSVRVATPGGSSGGFELSAHVSEKQPDFGVDPSAGVIDLAEVSINLMPVGPGSSVSPSLCTRAVDGTGYAANLVVTCQFGNLAVNTYALEVTVHGDYYTGYGEDVLVVYDPSLGFATGGGWFYWPGTTEKTNLGFTMKYNKKGQNVQGSLLLIRHLPDGSIYRVKSNALYGLALGANPTIPLGWASFSGKATYLEPGWLQPAGNYEFVVYVEDRNDPGAGSDRFWIEVKDQNRIIVPEMSMAREPNVNTVELDGGNIAVPHGRGASPK